LVADSRRELQEEPDACAARRDSFIEKYAHGSGDTVYAHKYVGKQFVKLMTTRGKMTPADLEETDIIAFDRFLESEGNSKNTPATRYGYIRRFLRHCGLNPSRVDDQDETSGVVSSAVHKKLKAKPVLRPETYNDSDLQKLYAVSSERHRLIWRAFRMLGLRDEELAYAVWDDLGWERKLWLVRFKPTGTFRWNPMLQWRSKDCEERDIPVPDVLYAELKAWRAKHQKTISCSRPWAIRPTSNCSRP
jgi:integrase